MQKQGLGLVDGWTPWPLGLLAGGNFKARDSTMSRMKGQESMVGSIKLFG